MNWIELTKVNSQIDAVTLRSYLEAYGIDVMIPNEHTSRVLSHQLPSLGFISIQVPYERLDEAKEMLREYSRQAKQAGYDANDSQYDELKTAHLAMAPDDLSKRALKNAIFGALMIPIVLNLYSIKLLIDIYTSPKLLRQTKKSNLYLAVFFNIVGLGFWFFLIF